MSSKWIWPFELMEKLGEGGMGVVYRARYVGNNRIVAVKLLPDDVASNENLVARFDREIEILKQLKHPHIVNCFGGVCESKQRFYAMELVEGGTLADHLQKRGRFTWDYVIDYGLQMCSALDYAHQRGVIHRDIKPGNFLLTKSGQIKLSDFGLATMIAAARITRAGKTAGTFQYMAPEQIQGKPPLSNRTDLYALGCVFFELLTGRPPFEAENPAAVLHMHLKEPPPRVITQCRDCPPELDQLIADLLEKNPDNRPESASVVAQRLDAILRPSRMGIDPFGHTANDVVAPVISTAKPGSSVSDVEVPTSYRRYLYIAWNLVILLAIASGGMWRQASYWKQQSQSWETAWVTAAYGTEYSLQLAALQELGRHGPLGATAESTVVAALGSPQSALRIAALKSMELQPSTLRKYMPQVLKIQQQDENDAVRAQAERTHDALKKAPTRGWWGTLAQMLLAITIVGTMAAPWLIVEKPWRTWFKARKRDLASLASSARRP